MKTQALSSIFISVVTAAALSGCGGSANSQAPTSNLPIAQVQWQQAGGLTGSAQIPLQQESSQKWLGVNALQFSGAVPDSLTIVAPMAQIDPMDGPNGLSNHPDHDRGRRGDDGNRDDKQSPTIHLSAPGIGANIGQSLQVTGDMEMDASGNMIIHARGLSGFARGRASAPICGSGFMLEVDLDHARLSLPVSIGC